MGRLRKHPPRVRYESPVHPTLRHTHLNRNPNSNLQHLKRDPLTTTYYFYTPNDIAKLFGLSHKTVRTLMSNGTIKNCIHAPPIISSTRTNKYGESSFVDQPLLAPAPSVLEFCTYFHERYIKIKSQPPYIPPILIQAAREYRDDIDENGNMREVPLSVQRGTSDI